MKFLKTKDLKLERERLFKEQDGFDPLVYKKIINPVLDHDHKEGYIRGVLDREVNQFVGKIEQNYIRFIKWKYPDIALSELLKNISYYLEKDYSSNMYHPNHLKTLIRKFSSGKKEQQIRVLEILGLKLVTNGYSKAELTKMYKKLLLNQKRR